MTTRNKGLSRLPTNLTQDIWLLSHCFLLHRYEHSTRWLLVPQGTFCLATMHFSITIFISEVQRKVRYSGNSYCFPSMRILFARKINSLSENKMEKKIKERRKERKRKKRERKIKERDFFPQPHHFRQWLMVFDRKELPKQSILQSNWM